MRLPKEVEDQSTPSQKHTLRYKITLWRLYLLLGITEGLISLTLLLSIPADPKNAWLFGFSRNRVALITALGLGLLGFLWAFYRSWCQGDRLPAIISSIDTFMRERGLDRN